jgi:hypothetical protein
MFLPDWLTYVLVRRVFVARIALSYAALLVVE